jgi:hypothetical protein
MGGFVRIPTDPFGSAMPGKQLATLPSPLFARTFVDRCAECIPQALRA